jgi:hypothetical protein
MRLKLAKVKYEQIDIDKLSDKVIFFNVCALTINFEMLFDLCDY